MSDREDARPLGQRVKAKEAMLLATYPFYSQSDATMSAALNLAPQTRGVPA